MVILKEMFYYEKLIEKWNVYFKYIKKILILINC